MPSPIPTRAPAAFAVVLSLSADRAMQPLRCAAGTLLCFAISVFGADAPARTPGASGKPWIDMDYGPYFTASIEVENDNIANKGIAIRVDHGAGGVSRGTAFLLFDTDTLRCAAGWTGKGFIDWRNIALDSQHEVHPA